ncbi:AraC-like DNA-binding protein [Mucilaginibacter gracilis]|uniref:AraC-like DNA-binding protein n=1 Tax=Mucilaginibacter gracilis TaxID=423350 RepID=A0A495J1C0_9SPHI|nr:AraC family transcriptional regulator [Mucilaginibacter gracilis]RKR82128.1 AraC-like DNA-binding protein [Mucilaginibacter gracilis]
MLFQFGLRSSLLLIFFTHLLVYAFLFWKRGIQQERLSDKLLGTFLFLSALFIFPWMSGFAGWYDTQPYREVLFYTPFIHALFFGPLLYLYLKSLTNAHYRLQMRDWLHFLPGALYILWALLVVVTDKLIVGHYYLMNGDTDPDFDNWYNWAWSASLMVYLVLSIRYYRQYVIFSWFEFSFADAASFKWLRNFLYAFAVLTILLLSEHILGLFMELFYVKSWYYFFAFAIIIYYVAISAYAAKPIIKLNFEPALLLSYQEPLLLDTPVAVVEDQSWMEEWKAKIEELMDIQKVYLEPELTLTELARKAGTNASLLSKVINKTYGLNFSDYVNRYRVNEVIRLLEQPAYQNFTLLAVAYDAGFNSKSTFNRAFKKVTGVIPKDYQKH